MTKILSTETDGIHEISQVGKANGGFGIDVSTGLTNDQIAIVAGNTIGIGPLTATALPTGIDAIKIGAGIVDNTEFGYLDGATSNIQTQLDSKAPAFGSQTANTVYAAPNGMAGTPTFRAVVNADLPIISEAKGGLGSDTSALSAGIVTKTATNTYATRTLTAPAAGITITNPAGTAGNPTLVLADDLAAVEALATAGLATRTGTSTWTTRALTQPAAGITITNSDGVSGSPTFALANDLAAVEGLAANGIACRTATDTWSARTLTGPAAGITVTNGGGVAGNPTLALANDLSAVEGLAGTGLAVRTATDTWTNRTIVGGTGITMTNGDGVSGNPSVALTSSSITLTQPAAGLTIAGSPVSLGGTATFALANDLGALEALATNGMAARTGTSSWTTRTITAGAGISVSNGDGISGNPTISTASPDVQSFTASGTWTKPSGNLTRITLIGGGGGGGSGRRAAAAAFGGGGGGGGAVVDIVVRTSTLSSTETVTVGAGGAGGAAQTVDNTDGNDGVNGGQTSTSIGTNNGVFNASGGSKGLKGTATDGIGGAGGLYGMFAGGAGGSAGSVAGGNSAAVYIGCSGGGSGGSWNGVSQGSGGTGGNSQIHAGWYANGGGPGTNGEAGSSSIGGAGTPWTGAGASNLFLPGGGGGGGGARDGSGVAGNGGAGTIYGGGAGGGGGNNTGANSGAGGAGAGGLAVYITY